LQQTEQVLRNGSALDQIYRPILPIQTLRGAEVLSYYFYADCEVMRMHDAVRLPLMFVMGPLHYAEWVIEANSRAVAIFAAKQLQWFWQNALTSTATEGYTYGWAATELDYCDKDGLLQFHAARTFCPRDCVPLLSPRRRRPIGVRVTGTMGGHRNMWAWREDVPNKCLWYTHQQRYGQLFGESQIRPAWRPWRRLAGIDGLEEIQDLATYKHGVGVTIVRHPNDKERAEVSANPRYAQNGWVHTQDIARSLVQNTRYGSGIALPSETWGEAGGGLKWDYEVRAFATNIEQLGQHDDRLGKKCSRAIGVPDELFQAASTGSGYSGRAIPLQGFLVGQQPNLVNMTGTAMKYGIMPLCKWNYGRNAWVTATPKPLLESVRRMSWDSPGDKGDDQVQQQQRPPMSQGVDLPPGPDEAASEPQDDEGHRMLSRVPDPAFLTVGELTTIVEAIDAQERNATARFLSNTPADEA
jgi:hypothetical protein